LFLKISDGEIEIDARFLTRCEAHALAANRFETCKRDIEAILTGRQAGGRVDAIAGGDDDSLTIRSCFGDPDDRAGSGSPGLILNNAGNLPGTGLAKGGCDTKEPRARDGEAD
jgi:hypothetical protein